MNSLMVIEYATTQYYTQIFLKRSGLGPSPTTKSYVALMVAFLIPRQIKKSAGL